MIMHLQRCRVSTLNILVVICALTISTTTQASSISGGVFTSNIDAIALAAAFSHNHDPNRRSFYLEEYFNAEQAAGYTSSELLTSHIVPGAGEISGVGRQLTVNSSQANGLNKSTNFNFDPNDLAGTATGTIGLGGAQRYRLNIPFSVSATGEEEGNRAITAYFSLEYDVNRIDVGAGHSGWVVFNHHSFRSDMFDLDNVITTLTADTLLLSGDLALASGFNHMGGQQGSIVGDFSFQTTVVPIPGAIWLFASSLAGMGIFRRRSFYLQATQDA